MFPENPALTSASGFPDPWKMEEAASTSLGDEPQPTPEYTSAMRYYPYQDHLGSIVALTDGTGTVVHRQAFDAWGRRRKALSWETDDSQAPPAGFAWLRGYTGHEHLDGFGIINRNARLYLSRKSLFLHLNKYPHPCLGCFLIKSPYY